MQKIVQWRSFALFNVPYLIKTNIREPRANLYSIGVLVSGPVIIACAITLGSLSYQFGEAATKLLVKNLINALSASAFIMHQRIKLAFY
jgi:hypothetical protein